MKNYWQKFPSLPRQYQGQVRYLHHSSNIQFPVPINPIVSIPASSEIISDPGLQSMQERLSAIRQPSSGPFIPPVSRAPQGFNFGQDGKTSVPPIFKMGSVKTTPPEKHVHFQTGIKADTNANFEPKDKTEWY